MQHVRSTRYALGVAILVATLANASVAQAAEASEKGTADSSVSTRQDDLAKIMAHLEMTNPQTMRQMQALQTRCDLDNRHAQSALARPASAQEAVLPKPTRGAPVAHTH